MVRFLWVLLVAPLAAAPLQPLADSLRLAPAEATVVPFDLSPAVQAQRPSLRLLARLDRPALGGSTYTLRLWVNDHPIDLSRLRNKPAETQTLSGLILPWYSGGRGFRVVYSPDYEAANRNDNKFCLVGGKAYEFVFDIADLLGEGQNQVRLEHREDQIAEPLVIEQLSLVEPLAPLPDAAEEVGSPPPTGPLERYEPQPPVPIDYTVRPLPRGGLGVRYGDREIVVRSAFTYPDAGWNGFGETALGGEEPGWQPRVTPLEDGFTAVATGASYRLERRVVRRPDHLTVADTFTNLTEQDQHISLRHGIVTAELPNPRIRLHGTELNYPQGNARGGDNPTALVSLPEVGFGMVAEDDVLRVQAQQVADPDLGEVGLLDHYFQLPPRESYTTRWSLYVVPGGDYFDFVNAVRRNWGTNFTIPGPFAFIPHPLQEPVAVPELEPWLRNTGVTLLSQQIPRTEPRRLAHGLAFLTATAEQARLAEQLARVRAIAPAVDLLCYIDIYVTSLDDAPTRYPAARHLDPSGEQYRYPSGSWQGDYWQFVPTTTNDYGREMAKYFDLCLDELGYDGIYWDQVSHPGRYLAYGLSDGHSGLTDNTTWAAGERLAFIPLLSAEYQAEQARRVLDAGKVLVGNSQPETETMTKLHFPRFVEAWHPSKLADAHLYCPVGLGSPDRIQTEADIAKNIREHLQWGGLWYYYLVWNKVHLTHASPAARLFPFTPIELHEGYLIGEERILTVRSGLFGWGDGSERRVYVYDEKGVEQPAFVAPRVEVDGKVYTELRLPGGWMGVVERG